MNILKLQKPPASQLSNIRQQLHPHVTTHADNWKAILHFYYNLY